MLQTRKQYINYLNDTSEILESIDISSQEQQALITNMENIELLIPVVGGFSAGKSTLINEWLGEDILSTNLTPETALATELRYHQDSFIEAVKHDDNIDKYHFNQYELIKKNTSQYKFLRLYLNKNKLKSIEPLILVDMPGFDSPLKEHNMAILNYLTKGVYFVVLSTIEDGNLTKSTIRELENMLEFGKGFSFCLSKANLRSQQDVLNVKKNIEVQLEEYLDITENVIPLYSENAGEELGNILNKIDAEYLFKKIFNQSLKYNYQEIESTINIKLSTLKNSKQEAADMLEELNEAKNKIISQKQKMIDEARSQGSNFAVESIIKAVEHNLRSNKDSLVRCAIQNKDSFSREVNEIVKNTLVVEVREKLNVASHDFVDDFKMEMQSLGDIGESFGLDEKWINTISDSTINLLKNAQDGLNDMLESKKNSKGVNLNSYRIGTSVLAITTAIINPVLELMIIFLPDIINFFTKGSQEAKKKEKIEDTLLHQVIPSIKVEIKPKLSQLFQEQINIIIDAISDKFETQLQQKTQEILQTQQEKDANIQQIDLQVNDLSNARNKIQTLANDTLYKEKL